MEIKIKTVWKNYGRRFATWGIFDGDTCLARISTGNRYIKDTVIWSLPQLDTCPGSTIACRKVCYANKAYCNDSKVKDSRWTNLVFSQREDFVEKMVKLINATNLSRVRIHEAGDFYSLAYARKWVEIAKRLPEIKFWTYSRSWEVLDAIGELPVNLNIRYSVDETTKHYPTKVYSFTYMGEKEGVMMCQAKREGSGILCGGCRLCYDTNIPVWFPIH